TSNMKKLFVLTMLISFAMVCSCQKQSSAAERQLAQRKAELDAREKALDEREKALAERENPTASTSTLPPKLQSPGKVTDPKQVGKVTDHKQMQAEIEKRIQQLPSDVRDLIPDPEQGNAKNEAKMQERRARRERRLEEQKEEMGKHKAEVAKQKEER